MSKTKKIFIIAFVLILVGVGVFVAIRLLSPKPDLMAPYENFYVVTNSNKYDTIYNYNDKLTEYMQVFTDESLKTTSENYIKKYTYVKNLFDVYETSNEFISENLLYLTDHDNKLVTIQRKVTEKHQQVLDAYDVCTSYIRTDIAPIEKEKNTNSWTMMNSIVAYDNLFTEFLIEYSEFYNLVGELFSSYTTPTINANPYSQQNVKSTMIWAEKILNNILEGKFDGVEQSLAYLANFTSLTFVSNPNEYFYNFEYYDGLIKLVQSMDESYYDLMANNTIKAHIDQMTNEEEKENITKIMHDYFEISVIEIPAQGGEE